MVSEMTSGQELLMRRPVQIDAAGATLDGELSMPAVSHGVILFAHGSGGSRQSPRHQLVAQALNEGGLATLFFDLLTPGEARVDSASAQLRFDIPFLASRVGAAVDWMVRQPEARDLPLGLFGASTGAAAALVAAAIRPSRISAIVSRGGRPDLAARWLSRVSCPVLLIVGSRDEAVLDLNRIALEELRSSEARLALIPGATHLFAEPGALERAALLVRQWFLDHFAVVRS